MKVLIISNLYGPLSKGGAEVVAAEQAEQYRRQGHQVIVLTSAVNFVSQPRPVQPDVFEYSPKNLTVYYHLGRLAKIWRWGWHLVDTLSPRSDKVIASWLKVIKPDLIITHNLKGLGLTLVRAIKHSKITWHHFCHDVQLILPSGLLWWGQEAALQSWCNRGYQLICRRLFNSPARVIFPSQWLADLYRQYKFFPGSEIQINRPARQPFSRIPPLADNLPLKLLFVGQIERHKGIIWLVEIWPELKKLLSCPVTLTVAGDGAALLALKTAADPTITWLGRVNHEQISSLMRQHHLLIVPSLCYENLPQVIKEAQAAGLAVVASRLGGIPEAVSPENTFTPQQVNDLAAAINNCRG